VFLLKLCWGGGKDEMTTCVSKNALEVSTGICSARFDSSEIFIEFIIGLKNNRGRGGQLAGGRQLLLEMEGVTYDSRGVAEEGMAEESASWA
jgi:hypothetical protein